MNEVEHISLDLFLKKYQAQKIDLVKKGLFSREDIEELREIDDSLSMVDRVSSLVLYFKFSIIHPYFVNSFIIPQLKKKLVGSFLKQNKTSWKNENLVKTNNLKATLVKVFNPKNILEIGTYLGVGAATFKFIIPESTVYTMSPKNTKGSNNPVFSRYVGYFFRKKGITIKQIWADSTKYNYSKLPQIDFTYIDGNHEFEYVYSDLKNSAAITRKCILVDDYIPLKEAKKRNLVFGPWNEGVVGATDKFLNDNPSFFKEAYWIKGTKYAVLIK